MGGLSSTQTADETLPQVPDNCMGYTEQQLVLLRDVRSQLGASANFSRYNTRFSRLRVSPLTSNLADYIFPGHRIRLQSVIVCRYAKSRCIAT